MLLTFRFGMCQTCTPDTPDNLLPYYVYAPNILVQDHVLAGKIATIFRCTFLLGSARVKHFLPHQQWKVSTHSTWPSVPILRLEHVGSCLRLRQPPVSSFELVQTTWGSAGARLPMWQLYLTYSVARYHARPHNSFLTTIAFVPVACKKGAQREMWHGYGRSKLWSYSKLPEQVHLHDRTRSSFLSCIYNKKAGCHTHVSWLLTLHKLPQSSI
jgi:hypothetical protein